MQKPLRRVIHIQRRGDTWDLLLECGHVALRPVRNGMRLWLAGEPLACTAPQRCRCVSCAEGLHPHSDTWIRRQIQTREAAGLTGRV